MDRSDLENKVDSWNCKLSNLHVVGFDSTSTSTTTLSKNEPFVLSVDIQFSGSGSEKLLSSKLSMEITFAVSPYAPGASFTIGSVKLETFPNQHSYRATLNYSCDALEPRSPFRLESGLIYTPIAFIAVSSSEGTVLPNDWKGIEGPALQFKD